MVDYLKEKWTEFRDMLRAGEFAVLAIVAIVAVVILVPHRIPSLIAMAAQFSIAAYFGYWADRICFKYARPHTLEGRERAIATLRRGVIMAGALVGAGMSL